MAVDTSRIMIKTFVKSVLKDAEEAPERCTRNLVDMALNFAEEGSQKSFFKVARNMLNNENSPYYPLIEDILKHMTKDKLLNFGIDIGYNSCTKGAKIIRETESREHIQIPWLLTLETGRPEKENFFTDYQSVFDQGKALGIYTYQLHVTESPSQILELTANNPDCAVILFCRSELITEDFAEAACKLNNVLIAVEYDDTSETACLILRDHKLLYSLYYVCDPDNASTVISGSFFRFAEELHSPFAAVVPQPSCPETLQEEIYKLVLKSRNNQLYRTIPLDLSKDTRLAGNIISPPACVIGFDREGHLCTDGKKIPDTEANLFHNPLREILGHYFPKETSEF